MMVQKCLVCGMTIDDQKDAYYGNNFDQYWHAHPGECIKAMIRRIETQRERIQELEYRLACLTDDIQRAARV